MARVPPLRTSKLFRQEGHLSASSVSRKAPWRGPISMGVPGSQHLPLSLEAPRVGRMRRGRGQPLAPDCGAWLPAEVRTAESVEGNAIPAIALRFSLGPTDPDVSQTSGAGGGADPACMRGTEDPPQSHPFQRKRFGSASLAAIPCKILGSQVKDFFCLRNFVTICVADRHRRPASRHPVLRFFTED